MTRIPAALVLLAAALGAPMLAHAKAADGGSLICGGVGSDERRAMAGESEGANLSIENATAGGAYLADVEVVLSPEKQDAPGFAFRADGPLCYLQVPPGSYRIEATHEGKRRTARAEVAAAPRKPTHITLAFPEEKKP
jgi:hypothetical protein